MHIRKTLPCLTFFLLISATVAQSAPSAQINSPAPVQSEQALDATPQGGALLTLEPLPAGAVRLNDYTVALPIAGGYSLLQVSSDKTLVYDPAHGGWYVQNASGTLRSPLVTVALPETLPAAIPRSPAESPGQTPPGPQPLVTAGSAAALPASPGSSPAASEKPAPVPDSSPATAQAEAGAAALPASPASGPAQAHGAVQVRRVASERRLEALALSRLFKKGADGTGTLLITVLARRPLTLTALKVGGEVTPLTERARGELGKGALLSLQIPGTGPLLTVTLEYLEAGVSYSVSF